MRSERLYLRPAISLLAIGTVYVAAYGALATVQPSAGTQTNASCETAYEQCMNLAQRAGSDTGACEKTWKTCVEKKCTSSLSSSGARSCPDDSECQRFCTQDVSSVRSPGLISCCQGGASRANTCATRIDGACIDKDDVAAMLKKQRVANGSEEQLQNELKQFDPMNSIPHPMSNNNAVDDVYKNDGKQTDTYEQRSTSNLDFAKRLEAAGVPLSENIEDNRYIEGNGAFAQMYRSDMLALEANEPVRDAMLKDPGLFTWIEQPTGGSDQTFGAPSESAPASSPSFLTRAFQYVRNWFGL